MSVQFGASLTLPTSLQKTPIENLFIDTRAGNQKFSEPVDIEYNDKAKLLWEHFTRDWEVDIKEFNFKEQVSSLAQYHANMIRAVAEYYKDNIKILPITKWQREKTFPDMTQLQELLEAPTEGAMYQITVKDNNGKVFKWLDKDFWFSVDDTQDSEQLMNKVIKKIINAVTEVHVQATYEKIAKEKFKKASPY